MFISLRILLEIKNSTSLSFAKKYCKYAYFTYFCFPWQFSILCMYTLLCSLFLTLLFLILHWTACFHFITVFLVFRLLVHFYTFFVHLYTFFSLSGVLGRNTDNLLLSTKLFFDMPVTIYLWIYVLDFYSFSLFTH